MAGAVDQVAELHRHDGLELRAALGVRVLQHRFAREVTHRTVVRQRGGEF